jgi:hypothetical protein
LKVGDRHVSDRQKKDRKIMKQMTGELRLLYGYPIGEARDMVIP